MGFTAEESRACRRLVEMALEEDLGTAGDITSKAVIPPDLQGQAAFVARAPGVVAGLPAVELVLETVHTPLLKMQPLVEDGTRVHAGDRIALVTGLTEFILTAERTALNFLQRLSGIATLTRRYVDAIAGLPCQILDTRKTVPGFRILDKYAVRCGGGHNHRLDLSDGILIKNNHIAIAGGVAAALKKAQQGRRGEQPLEIEVRNFAELEEALANGAEAILLDNMTVENARAAIERIRTHTRRIPIEVSGGVKLENVRSYAETGAEYISVGALTHSPQAADLSMRMGPA